MYQNKKIIVVMPAYNAAQTLIQTYEEVMAQGIVDLVVFVDDASSDNTAKIASGLSRSRLHVHKENLGYGGNQKTCYRIALEEGADVVIMVHPDYQYTPKLIPAMASLIASGLYHCVLGSRILGRLRHKRRHAFLEVHCQPLFNAHGKYFNRSKIIRISHRLQSFFP